MTTIVQLPFFCLPLPGKPNPNEAYDPSSGKKRSRVVQKQQKGDTCGYYALQILRDEKKIGKCCSDTHLLERKIETTISAHRKMMTHITTEIQSQLDFAKNVTSDFGFACIKVDAQAILNDQRDNMPIEKRDLFCAALKDFCEQTEFGDLLSFTEDRYLQARRNADNFLLKEFNIPEEFVALSYRAIGKMTDRPWEELTLIEADRIKSGCAFLASAQKYGARKSSWHPAQSIQKLIEQLQLHGPHLIKGNVGRAYYEDDPFELRQKIQGRSVFGWKPGAKRRDESGTHVVVIVGADEKRVYYVDPMDGSDPEDIEAQIIYTISYERLQMSICNLIGIEVLNRKQNQPAFEPQLEEENNYALYLDS